MQLGWSRIILCRERDAQRHLYTLLELCGVVKLLCGVMKLPGVGGEAAGGRGKLLGVGREDVAGIGGEDMKLVGEGVREERRSRPKLCYNDMGGSCA